MRFHIGFSKRISAKTLLWLLGTIFLGVLAFFGLTEQAYADTLNNKTPSTFEYYNDYYNTAQSPSLYSNDYDYFWYINNPGFNSYNYTFIYNFSSLCPTGFARLSTKFTLSFSDVFYPNSLSFVTTYNNGGTLNASISTEGNFMRVTFPLVDLTKSIKIVMNTTRSELVSRALVNKSWDYTCISDGTSDIIDNASQNTQDIIDNQNQNTQDIIDNQNDNTQAIIDSNKVCSVIDKNLVNINGKYLSSSGVPLDNSYFGITDYVKISSSDILTYTSSYSGSSTYACFYDFNKTKISCFALSSYSASSVISIPSNSYYFRSTIYTPSNLPTYTLCKNGNSAITDSLTDSNVDSNTGTGFFNININEHGIANILTSPIRLLQALTTSNNSCNSLDFTINLGGMSKAVSIPSGCILWDNVPSSISLIFIAIVYGLFAYYVLIDLYKFVHGLLDPDDKNMYVLDL